MRRVSSPAQRSRTAYRAAKLMRGPPETFTSFRPGSSSKTSARPGPRRFLTQWIVAGRLARLPAGQPLERVDVDRSLFACLGLADECSAAGRGRLVLPEGSRGRQIGRNTYLRAAHVQSRPEPPAFRGSRVD